ncbi:hypothetical protein PUN28_004909 [Cardiocondyla obscurior]|uniref:Uncharacterized protein n=1 Tax=Cardiocondyla obscurior TaxID=286306 RepID=A0AAW2GDJ0_9HYME
MQIIMIPYLRLVCDISIYLYSIYFLNYRINLLRRPDKKLHVYDDSFTFFLIMLNRKSSLNIQKRILFLKSRVKLNLTHYRCSSAMQIDLVNNALI